MSSGSTTFGAHVISSGISVACAAMPYLQRLRLTSSATVCPAGRLWRPSDRPAGGSLDAGRHHVCRLRVRGGPPAGNLPQGVQQRRLDPGQHPRLIHPIRHRNRTDTGPTPGRHWTDTGPTPDRHWTDSRPTPGRHRAGLDAVSPLTGWSSRVVQGSVISARRVSEEAGAQDWWSASLATREVK